MNTIKDPIVQTYWYLPEHKAQPLHGEKKCDIAIVGGGMAGLHAAHAFRQKGLSVVLVEKNFCGSGASGKSSGFITPDSELPLYQLVEEYGIDGGKKLWEFVSSGVELIRHTLHEHQFVCDYIEQETCVVANSVHAFKAHNEKEHAARQQLGYTSTLYDAQAMQQVMHAQKYHGAVRYPGSFGINAYHYCQAFKNILQQEGVDVYEDTPAISIGDHFLETPHGRVTADKIILCVDRFLPDLEKSAVADAVSYVQTFLMISEQLSDKQVQQMFPAGPLMAWDTDALYSYFRLTGDNRLLLGGGSWFSLYDKREAFSNRHVRNQLLRYRKRHFPQLDISFRYFWPGMIGVSKDITPVAGVYHERPWLYYVGAATGLPWAAALGRYSAEHFLEGRSDFDEFFSPYRKFPLGSGWKYVMGKRLTFALSQGITLYVR